MLTLNICPLRLSVKLHDSYFLQTSCCPGYQPFHTRTRHWSQCMTEYAPSAGSYTLTFWHRSFAFNSNKSPTWCKNFSVYYLDVCLQLNMFRAFSRPSSGAQWLQWQPLVLPSYRGDSRAVFAVGPAGPTAPDDGRKNARNMLRCKQSQDNKLKNCCTRLVIYFNCTMMHGLTNLKFYI